MFRSLTFKASRVNRDHRAHQGYKGQWVLLGQQVPQVLKVLRATKVMWGLKDQKVIKVPLVQPVQSGQWVPLGQWAPSGHKVLKASRVLSVPLAHKDHGVNRAHKDLKVMPVWPERKDPWAYKVHRALQGNQGQPVFQGPPAPKDLVVPKVTKEIRVTVDFLRSLT